MPRKQISQPIVVDSACKLKPPVHITFCGRPAVSTGVINLRILFGMSGFVLVEENECNVENNNNDNNNNNNSADFNTMYKLCKRLNKNNHECYIVEENKSYWVAQINEAMTREWLTLEKEQSRCTETKYCQDSIQSIDATHSSTKTTSLVHIKEGRQQEEFHKEHVKDVEANTFEEGIIENENICMIHESNVSVQEQHITEEHDSTNSNKSDNEVRRCSSIQKQHNNNTYERSHNSSHMINNENHNNKENGIATQPRERHCHKNRHSRRYSTSEHDKDVSKESIRDIGKKEGRKSKTSKRHRRHDDNSELYQLHRMRKDEKRRQRELKQDAQNALTDKLNIDNCDVINDNYKKYSNANNGNVDNTNGAVSENNHLWAELTTTPSPSTVATTTTTTTTTALVSDKKKCDASNMFVTYDDNKNEEEHNKLIMETENNKRGEEEISKHVELITSHHYHLQKSAHEREEEEQEEEEQELQEPEIQMRHSRSPHQINKAIDRTEIQNSNAIGNNNSTEENEATHKEVEFPRAMPLESPALMFTPVYNQLSAEFSLEPSSASSSDSEYESQPHFSGMHRRYLYDD